MLKSFLIAILVAVAATLLYAATRPDHFRVERSADISAPPAAIFALINDFHAWSQWSPYEKLDPAMQRTYSDPAVGVGARYAWDSQGQAGAGHMQITESQAPSRIVIALDFTRPFASHNTTIFTLQSDGAITHVSWAMQGPSPYISRLMGIFFNMDELIGRDFSAGLTALKSITEGATDTMPAAMAPITAP